MNINCNNNPNEKLWKFGKWLKAFFNNIERLSQGNSGIVNEFSKSFLNIKKYLNFVEIWKFSDVSENRIFKVFQEFSRFFLEIFREFSKNHFHVSKNFLISLKLGNSVTSLKIKFSWFLTLQKLSLCVLWKSFPSVWSSLNFAKIGEFNDISKENFHNCSLFRDFQ